MELTLRDKQKEIVAFLNKFKGKILGVEAPTGIGKTVAYLQFARKWDGKVIIAPSTKALQDQITKEIQKFFPEISYSVLKGKNNYMCEDKLSLLPVEEQEIIKDTNPPIKSKEKWISSPEYCRKDYQCPHRYTTCSYFQTLKKCDESKVVIVNHYLINKVLARYRGEKILLIIDECHLLPTEKEILFRQEDLKEPEEPDPKKFSKKQEFNLEIEKFLKRKRKYQLTKKLNISSPGKYTIKLHWDFSCANKVIFVSATFPPDLYTDDFISVPDERRWDNVTLSIINSNYKQKNYLKTLFSQIEKCLKKYDKTIILATNKEIVRKIANKFPEIEIEGKNGNSKEILSDKLKSGKTKAIAGCNALWSGIDVPGIKAIIMTKLPFPEYRDGKEFEKSVSEMTVLFKQGCGRMIRTDECGGEIIIIDNRIYKYPSVMDYLDEKQKLGAKIISSIKNIDKSVIPLKKIA